MLLALLSQLPFADNSSFGGSFTWRGVALRRRFLLAFYDSFILTSRSRNFAALVLDDLYSFEDDDGRGMVTVVLLPVAFRKGLSY